MSKSAYYTIIGGTPLIVPLDVNRDIFNVSIRTDATTVEFTVESPADAVAKNTFSPAVGPAVTWLAAPAAVNGIVNINFPVQAIRLSKASNGSATVLQQGI